MRHLHRAAALALTVCMLFAFASCGKTQDSLHARFAVLYQTDLLKTYLQDPQTYADQIAGYALEDFAQTFADADAFRLYSVEVTLQNTNDYAVDILNLQMPADKQGTDGVYFSTYSANGIVGLPAGFTGEQSVFFQAIAASSLSMQDVLKTLGKMGVECVFADAAANAEDEAPQIDPSALHVSSILYEG
ncbi:MAG: hypothetical protein IJT44_13355 [Clostridia bacterium]|nr:hypothetical protein [Clostridia bacterium]